jgi:hypothetical protein
MRWPAFPGLVALGPEVARVAAQVAEAAGALPVDLAVVIEFESRWNPKAVNAQSGATGLIQWLPSTASGLGMVSSTATASAEIQAMPAAKQLAYVLTYLLAAKAGRTLPKPMPLSDLYLLVFTPAGAGKPVGTIIWEAGSAAAQQNPGLQDSAGAITTDSVATVMAAQKARALALPTWDDGSKNRNGGISGYLWLAAAGVLAAALGGRR